MHLLLQRRLKRRLSNMHRRHPAAVTGPDIIFSNLVSLLLGDHARAGATPSPTDMAFAIAVSHCDGVT